MLDRITPLILTFNEAPNIERTLNRLNWAQRIVVIDSYSTDATIDILRSHPHVEIFSNKFVSFAAQCNYGLEKIQSEWVLSLDADYILSAELIAEIDTTIPISKTDSYFVKFKYCVFGKPYKERYTHPVKSYTVRIKQFIKKTDTLIEFRSTATLARSTPTFTMTIASL